MSTAADDDSTPNDANDEKPPAPGETGKGAAAGPPPLADKDNAEPDAEANRAAASEKLESNLPDAMRGGAANVALGQGTMSEKDEKTFGLLIHVLGVFPLVGPLVLWILKRDTSPFIDDQGRESIAYQLIYVIALVVVGILCATPIGCIAWIGWPIAGVGNLVFVIMAGLKAGDGIAYRYPFALRVI